MFGFGRGGTAARGPWNLLFGGRGERAAARFLRRRGFRILLRGYRTTRGEIDLVARDGETLVFVEVKTRSRGMPAEAVTPEKQRRLTLAALHFLKRHGLLDRPREVPCRFDVVAIVLARGPRSARDRPSSRRLRCRRSLRPVLPMSHPCSDRGVGAPEVRLRRARGAQEPHAETRFSECSLRRSTAVCFVMILMAKWVYFGERIGFVSSWRGRRNRVCFGGVWPVDRVCFVDGAVGQIGSVSARRGRRNRVVSNIARVRNRWASRANGAYPGRIG